MIFALALISAVMVSGLVVLLVGLRDAPEAEQTLENGFQIVWRNHNPESQDVACIWEERAKQSSTAHSSGFHAAA